MKNPTYVVHCRRGFNKLTCPLILQQGILCVECANAFYVKREPAPKESTTAEPETEPEQKQND
jgi:hypothetical protein